MIWLAIAPSSSAFEQEGASATPGQKPTSTFDESILEHGGRSVLYQRGEYGGIFDTHRTGSEIDKSVLPERFEGAVHMHARKAEKIGQRLLCDGKVETVFRTKRDRPKSFADFEKQIDDALISTHPAEPCDLAKQIIFL